MNISFKSKPEDTTQDYIKKNIKICDFFDGAALPAATQPLSTKYFWATRQPKELKLPNYSKNFWHK